MGSPQTPDPQAQDAGSVESTSTGGDEPESNGRTWTRWGQIAFGLVVTLAGLLLSYLTWRDAQAAVELEVKSIQLVRAEIPLKSLDDLPEFQLLKYEFIRDEVTLAREMLQFENAVGLASASFYSDEGFVREHRAVQEARTLPALATRVVMLGPDEQEQWIERTAALAERQAAAREKAVPALTNLQSSLDGVRTALKKPSGGGGAGGSLDDSNPFRAVVRDWSVFKDQLQAPRLERDPWRQESLWAQVAARFAGTVCSELERHDVFSAECLENSLHDSLLLAGFVAGDGGDQSVDRVVDAAKELVSEELLRVKTGGGFDVARTREQIAAIREDAKPQHLELVVVAGNRTNGLATLASRGQIQVYVGFGHDFAIEIGLASHGSNDITPASLDELVYRSQPWDEMTPDQRKTILRWWNSRTPAVFYVEDNEHTLRETPQFLFADSTLSNHATPVPVDSTRYRVGAQTRTWFEESWREWSGGFGLSVVLVVLGVIALGSLPVRYVWLRRRQIWRSFVAQPGRGARGDSTTQV